MPPSRVSSSYRKVLRQRRFPRAAVPGAVAAEEEAVHAETVPHVEALETFLRSEPRLPAIKAALVPEAVEVVVVADQPHLLRIFRRTAAFSSISNRLRTPLLRWSSGSPPRTGTESSWVPGMEDLRDPFRAWVMPCHKPSVSVMPPPVPIPAIRIPAANGRSAIPKR